MSRLCRLLRFSHLAALALAVCAAASPTAGAADGVVVETTDGRVFAGQFDRKTSPQALQIRSGTATMYVVRPIDWNAIERVRIDGKALSRDQILKQFQSSGWPSAVEDLPNPPAPAPSGPRFPAPSDAYDDGRSASTLPYIPVVTSIAIEASTGRWTSGADNSGILVRVYPMDAFGQIVQVDGVLEVDLIGQNPATLTRGTPFMPIARWAQQVRAQDVGGNGAIYRFAYQAYNPEFDLDLGCTGLVHARLSVPGQGVYDDTATMVVLRPFSTTRDRWQEFSGERFFPQERTNRGVVDGPGWGAH